MKATLAAVVFLTGLAASVANAGPFIYRDMCEASAAVALGPDHFVAASDESNVLRIYKRGDPKAVALPNLQAFIGFDKSDLEGVAALDGEIFWISSHSLNKSGGDKKRKVLFATKQTTTEEGQPRLQAFGKVFGGLRDPLRAFVQNAIGEEVSNKAINIEGLAAGPDHSLLIGLREPLHDLRALVVRLNNPLALVSPPSESPVVPEFNTPIIELDLDGLGVRSIELVGTGSQSYLIAAGPVSDEAQFALYWWDGSSATVKPVDGFNFEGIKPEAMFALSDGQIQFLGDNGSDSCDEEITNQSDWWFPSIIATF